MTGPRWMVIAGAGLLVAGCTVNEPTATEVPLVPELVIVTATPGVPPMSAPARSVNQRYVVREGDSLSTIAERFEVSEAAILRANDLTDPNRILVGQELMIPPPEP